VPQGFGAGPIQISQSQQSEAAQLIGQQRLGIQQQPVVQQQSLADSTSNKPFTAVFVPGQPTQFKLGTPQDFSTGSYTSI
jgi:hypothetical protein